MIASTLFQGPDVPACPGFLLPIYLVLRNPGGMKIMGAPSGKFSKVATLTHETGLLARGFRQIAGVDEVGRGPLAGPVTAAAVILNPDRPIHGLADSKAISAAVREALAQEILAHACVSLAFVPAMEIDIMNIRAASLAAMRMAVDGLAVRPDFALIDGRDIPDGLPCTASALIGGDAVSASIAAASIIAKVMRDRLMSRADSLWPGYGFARHAGYGTALHKAAIAALGPCPIHRLSFAPFKNGTPENLNG